MITDAVCEPQPWISGGHFHDIDVQGVDAAFRITFIWYGWVRPQQLINVWLRSFFDARRINC